MWWPPVFYKFIKSNVWLSPCFTNTKHMLVSKQSVTSSVFSHPWSVQSIASNPNLSMCQPLHPQRQRDSKSKLPPLGWMWPTDSCRPSEGPRAPCACARAMLCIVPSCICCTHLAVHLKLNGKHKNTVSGVLWELSEASLFCHYAPKFCAMVVVIFSYLCLMLVVLWP